MALEQKINSANNEDQEESFISEILFKYLPYWPIFVLIVLVALSAAYIYLRYATPIYQTTANILIKDEKKGLDESSLMESLNLGGSKKIVENEIEVLRSKPILKEVVHHLKLYAPLTEEGRIRHPSAYTTSPVTVEVKSPDSLIEINKVYFNYSPAGNYVMVGKRRIAVNEWFSLNGNTMRFVPNINFIDSVKNKALYFSLVSVKKRVNSLVGQINVAPTSKQSTVIALTMQDEVPKRGEDILNELIVEYNKAAILDKNTLAANTLSFVEDRLHYVVTELDSVETVLQRYKTNKGIVDMSEQGKVFLQSVEENDRKVSEINVQLAVLAQVERYVTNGNDKPGILPTVGLSDPQLGLLLQRLYELEIQYERLKKTTAENNPLLLSIQDQIEKVKPSILQNIQNQRNNLLAGRANLNSTSNRYSSLLRTIPTQERELLEISRQQAIKNNIYTFLLQKREETALTFASTIPDSRVVNFAEASLAPVSPRPTFTYAIALAGGIALVIIILTLKELLNQNVLYRSEVEKLISWPVLGEISFEDTKDVIVTAKGERNVIAEQFRLIRTSLAYLGIDGTDKKNVLVTSSIPGEGKSFVAANLAVSLSLLDKKVVLLEMDLRKPKLSAIFKISKEVGLSNYSIGKATEEQIIKKTTVNDNLFFISAGPIPPNPSELILSERLQQLFNYLRERFDYIILDTAPVSPVTDAYILSKFCDTTLFIVRHAYTPKAILSRIQEGSQVRALKNVGIVFNGVKTRGFGKYSYGYGYGYSYGYGYGENEK